MSMPLVVLVALILKRKEIAKLLVEAGAVPLAKDDIERQKSEHRRRYPEVDRDWNLDMWS